MATSKTTGYGQIILVLQGGGALGAYQAGVYEALHEAGVEPDWVIGTSIGAINAGLIAGNAAQDRVKRLRSFWQRIGYSLPTNLIASCPGGEKMARLVTMMQGLNAFFVPNMAAMLGGDWPLAAENAGLYSTAPLRQTLAQLIDFSLIGQRQTRISVGAANVGTAQMRYFDSRDITFRLEHVLASGALPPAFPPIRVDGELYWDGGILSNTPLEAIFDDNPRRDSLIFAVHVWNPDGAEPHSMAEVLNRQKDVQYASRSRSQVARQQQIHKLRHVIAEMTKRLPADERASLEMRDLVGYGCVTRMHIVALLAPTLPNEDYAKDIDFSARGIRARWDAGYAQTARALASTPWATACDPLEGVILHNFAP